MGGFRGGGGGGEGAAAPLFSRIFEKFLTLSLTFGHKCSQNDVNQHHQFLRPPLSGFSGSAPAIGSRMNGMIFRAFLKRNSSQKNTKTVYSEYSYSGIVPKERDLRLAALRVTFRLPDLACNYCVSFVSASETTMSDHSKESY